MQNHADLISEARALSTSGLGMVKGLLLPGTAFNHEVRRASLRKKMEISLNPKRGSTTGDARTKNSHLSMWNPVGVHGALWVFSWGAPSSRRPQALL